MFRPPWGTGLWISEVIKLMPGGVSRDGIAMLGTGNINQVVFVQDGMVTVILFCVGERALRRSDYLFDLRKDGQIAKGRADQKIRQSTLEAGLQRNVHAHPFRHGYIINFLSCGGHRDAFRSN